MFDTKKQDRDDRFVSNPKVLCSIPITGHQTPNHQRREFVAHPGSLPIIKRFQCSCINQLCEAYNWPDDRTKKQDRDDRFAGFQHPTMS